MFGSSFYHQLFISLTFFWCFQNTSNLTVEDKAEPSQENRSNEVPAQATEQKELADEGEGQEGEEETEKIEPEVETRSILTDDLKFDSTHETTQSNLSASSESNQENSTQEHTFDSNAMPEAGVGGPEILSVSSTSKLSSSIGMPEEEFVDMQKSDPAGTLRILLSKKKIQNQTSSEHTPSNSTPSNAEISSIVRQDSLLLKLATDYSKKDVLKSIEEDPFSAFGHLNFLKKLQNPLTTETVTGKILQMSSVIDRFAQVVQRRFETDKRLAAQQQAYALFYEKAQNAQAEADGLIKDALEGNPGLKTCDENIAFYEGRIEALQAQIDDYKRKIFDEQTKRAKIQEEIHASTQELIDAKGREGIEAFGAAEVVAEEIKALESSSIVVDKELASLKKLYQDCVKDL
jgi:hypothetical protein